MKNDSEKLRKERDHHWKMIHDEFSHWFEQNPNLGISHSTAWVIFHAAFLLGEIYERKFWKRTHKKKEK